MRIKLLFCFTLMFLCSPMTKATPIIIGYDIENATLSGQGNWSHSYNGTIVTTGSQTGNYSGGSGTLNNGVIENSHRGSQLFNFPSAHNPVITLFLDDFYTLSSLSLHSGNWGNTIPGEMTGLSVTLDGISAFFTTSHISPTYTEFVDFTSSALASISVNTVILSGFTSTWSTYNTFNISEITLSGTLASASNSSTVSAPGTILIMSLGLIAISLRKKFVL